MPSCPVCSSQEWLPYLQTKTDKLITGDQRISDGNINKVMCSSCGAVRNDKELSDQELEIFYGEAYELNTLGVEEHRFFTNDGHVARSKVFFDWICPHLPDSFDSLLEIGCGEGNLLLRFFEAFPDRKLTGIDGSAKAVKLAQKKGLSVKQQFIAGPSSKTVAGSYDVIILINVIEHVIDIRDFISKIRCMLNEGGMIIITLPIQDFGGYDIFFAEHIWHFTVNQFKRVLANNGLLLEHCDSDHPINHGIGLFVCRDFESVAPNQGNLPSPYSVINESDTFLRMKDKWLTAFQSIDRQLFKITPKRVAFFGSGEVFTLIMAFTNVHSLNTVVCIDETKEKQGSEKHGVPIFGIEWFSKNSCDAIVLATNPKYYPLIKEKLSFTDISLILLDN